MKKSELRHIIREAIKEQAAEYQDVDFTDGIDTGFCLTGEQSKADNVFAEKILSLNDETLFEDYIDVLKRTFGNQECEEGEKYKPPQKVATKGTWMNNLKRFFKKQFQKNLSYDAMSKDVQLNLQRINPSEPEIK